MGSFFALNRRAFLLLGVVLSLTVFSVATWRISAYAQTARTIRAVDASAQPGQQVTVSLQLDSQGNEAATSFTVNFDPTRLSNPFATIGTGVPGGSSLNTNPNEAASGRLGVLVDATNTYTQGTRQIMTIRFDVAPNAPNGSTTLVSFGNTPTVRSVSSANGTLLATTYVSGNVSIGPNSSPTPTPTPNPTPTLTPTPAATPTPTSTPTPTPTPTPIPTPTPSPTPNGRIIRAVSVGTQPGQQVTVSIQLDSQGNEAATSFTVNFDPTRLSNPLATVGIGVPSGSSLNTNPNEAANGRLGVLVDSTSTYAMGTRQIMTIRFDVAANAPVGSTPITFGNTPTIESVASVSGALLPATYQMGNVSIGSTPAGVQVSGRVLTPDGRGLRNATVSITDSNGGTRTTVTSSFGFYSFEDVQVGGTYIITVSSRRYRFTPRVLQVLGPLGDVDFVGLE